MRRIAIATLALVAALASRASAAVDKPTLAAGTWPPPPAEQLRLDGIMSEPAWAAADSISNLVTVEPQEGGVPTGRTVVRVLVNPEAICVGVRCFDPDPRGMISYSKARDSELDDEDHVAIVFNTFGDERSGFVFAINPAGARYDGLVTSQGEDVNSNWDAVWEAATETDSAGWGFEMRLPVQSLSFAGGLGEWGFNVERRIQRVLETSRWSGIKRDFSISQTSQAGRLVGLPKFDLGFGLTVRPGFVSNAKRPEFRTKRVVANDVSLDVNQKLGPNLSATVTANTDFGETEADVRQTNLTRFSLLFPERRSFFLEGADIFDFGTGLNVEDASIVPFFSRRIGIFVPPGEDPEEGQEVPVLAGAKLQGRIGQTSLGSLVVTTDRVHALGVPRATMGVLRLKRNILAESSVGWIGTAGDPLNRRDSWLSGVDLTFRTSHFRTDKNLQAGFWGLTTDRQGLNGDRYAFGGKLAYPNDLWNMGVTYLRVGTGFEPSMGFVQRTGHIIDSGIELSPRPEWGEVRQLSHELSYFAALTPGGSWESYLGKIKPVAVDFESGDHVEFTIEPQGERPREQFDVFDSPVRTVEILPGTYRWTRYSAAANLATKRRISGDLSWNWGGFYHGTLRTLQAGALLVPHDVITVQLSAERNLAKLKEGNFTQYLYGARVELKLSPNFVISNFIQYDNESRSLGSAARLRWTFNPLGDLFVAFNHNMVRPAEEFAGRWQFTSDQVLTKVQYSWRL